MFDQNAASKDGGAIYSVSDLSLNGCEFKTNEAYYHGGGLVSLGNLRRFQATKFINNWSGSVTIVGFIIFQRIWRWNNVGCAQ